MARNTTLVQLLDQLRIAARLSTNPGHNRDARMSQVETLQNVQERLWEDFDWGHLVVKRQKPAQAGQRYYDIPPDIDLARIMNIQVFYNGVWVPVKPGIEDALYTSYNSDLDERSWPIRRWRIYENEDIEVWPIGNQNASEETREGYLQFEGIRKLNPLIDDKDRADLDDRMIVLFAAAEILAARGANDAGQKLEQANARFNRIRSGMTPRRSFNLSGASQSHRHPRSIQVPYYNPDRG